MLLYRFSIFVALLFGSQLFAKTLLKDKFIFKVSGEVFSINDLAHHFKDMNTLHCIYPESLSFEIFKTEFAPVNKDQFALEGSIKREQRKYFEQLLPFYKLLVYTFSHDVAVNKALKKYFHLTAKQNRCSKDVFKDKDFTSRFNKLVKLEIFVRSRFLPAEREGKLNSQDVEKAILAARNLIASIDQQIEEEVYW